MATTQPRGASPIAFGIPFNFNAAQARWREAELEIARNLEALRIAYQAQLARIHQRAEVIGQTLAKGPGGDPRQQTQHPAHRSAPPAPKKPIAPMLGEQFRAGASGFADMATMGIADQVTSGLRAALDRRGESWAARYAAELAAEQARDRYDAEHYGLARNAGKVAGVGAAMLGAELTLPLRGAAVAGQLGLRLAPAAGRITPNINHVLRVGGAAGGAAGLIGQGASDGVERRWSSPADYVGSIGGGVLGGFSAPVLGPIKGGVVAGASTPILQSLAAGEMPSLSDATYGGMLGVMSGTIPWPLLKGDSPARRRLMGRIGEDLSKVSSLLLADWPVAAQVKTVLPNRFTRTGRPAYTVVDHVRKSGKLVESKMGDGAELSIRQRQAWKDFGSRYVPEHWLPRDVVNMLSVGATGLAGDLREWRERLRPVFVP